MFLFRKKLILSAIIIVAIFISSGIYFYFNISKIKENLTYDLHQFHNYSMKLQISTFVFELSLNEFSVANNKLTYNKIQQNFDLLYLRYEILEKYDKRFSLGFQKKFNKLEKNLVSIDKILKKDIKQVYKKIPTVQLKIDSIIIDSNSITTDIEVFAKKSISNLYNNLESEAIKVLIFFTFLIFFALGIIFLWDKQQKISFKLNEAKENLKIKNKDLIISHEIAEQNKRYFQSLFDQSSLSIQILDKNGLTLNVNRAWENLWQSSFLKVNGIYNILQDKFEKNELWFSQIRKIFNGNIVDLPLFELNPADYNKFGKKRILKCIAFPITKNDDIERIVVMYEDITEQKEVNYERDRLKDQLNQTHKLDAIGQLAGGVAHDFNNMLAGIMSASQLLKSPKRNLDQKSLNYVNIILQASIRAADLTAKLLAFGRKGKISSTIVDLHNIIDETIAILNRTIDKKISIKTQKEALYSTVIGDESSLQNLILNLGINASHAMEDGGTLSILTSNIKLNKTYCNASQFEIEPGDYVELEVRDNGTGISIENIKKIFEPFFTTKEQGKGTGLGLAAVYGTVLDHHGSITVYSEPGEGTAFHITLPSSKEVVSLKESHDKIISGKGKILLVDDEELIRITGTHVLEEMGYEVLLAEDGLEAIKMYKKFYSVIDIVIMDMIMPKMNGKEAFYELKKINKNCKVIISSGFTKNESLEDLQKNGLVGFIHKPFRNYDLGLLIHNSLN